jgi:O-antigen ligase
MVASLPSRLPSQEAPPKLNAQRLLPSDGLLILQIVLIPLMKPAVWGEVISADLLFVVIVVALIAESILGLRRLHWVPGVGALVVYVASLTPSLLATSDMGASLFKLATEFYLIGLAAVTVAVVDDRMKLRRALLAWLAATAVVSLDGVLSLLAFIAGWPKWLLDYSSFGFGSLPPGPYPRLALTFLNANMACNYLTASLGFTYLCLRLGYIPRISFWLLLISLIVTSMSTLSPGLGGIALLAGFLVWIDRSEAQPAIGTTAFLAGVVAAGLFIIALALTPFPHSTATFQVNLPGGITFYPAPRLLIWIAAFNQFVAHPWVGIGIGIDPVHVGFQNPNGFEVLTDAHNMFLSIAAQCGLVGLIGVAAILQMAVGRKSWVSISRAGALTQMVLCATFLDVFVYQGIGGSFEDTRHIWLLLGLLMTTKRIYFDQDEVARTLTSV